MNLLPSPSTLPGAAGTWEVCRSGAGPLGEKRLLLFSSDLDTYRLETWGPWLWGADPEPGEQIGLESGRDR